MTDHNAINLNVQQCKHPSVSGEQAIFPISTAKIIPSWNAEVNPSNHVQGKQPGQAGGPQQKTPTMSDFLFLNRLDET